MRVFQSYAELKSALDMPTDAPGAFRFLESFGPAGFVCACCKQVKPFQFSGGTGYALTQANEMQCYECCNQLDEEALKDRSKPFSAYLSGNGMSVTNWTGHKLGIAYRLNIARTGFNCSEQAYFRVQDIHGNLWYGRGVGKGMYCTLRPLKTKR